METERENMKSETSKISVFEKMKMIHNRGYSPKGGYASVPSRYRATESSRYYETKNLALKKSLPYVIFVCLNFILGIIFMAVIAGILPVSLRLYSSTIAIATVVLFLASLLFQRMFRYLVLRKVSTEEINELNQVIETKAEQGIPQTKNSKKLGVFVIILLIVGTLIVMSVK